MLLPPVQVAVHRWCYGVLPQASSGSWKCQLCKKAGSADMAGAATLGEDATSASPEAAGRITLGETVGVDTAMEAHEARQIGESAEFLPPTAASPAPAPAPASASPEITAEPAAAASELPDGGQAINAASTQASAPSTPASTDTTLQLAQEASRKATEPSRPRCPLCSPDSWQSSFEALEGHLRQLAASRAQVDGGLAVAGGLGDASCSRPPAPPPPHPHPAASSAPAAYASAAAPAAVVTARSPAAHYHSLYGRDDALGSDSGMGLAAGFPPRESLASGNADAAVWVGGRGRGRGKKRGRGGVIVSRGTFVPAQASASDGPLAEPDVTVRREAEGRIQLGQRGGDSQLLEGGVMALVTNGMLPGRDEGTGDVAVKAEPMMVTNAACDVVMGISEQDGASDAAAAGEQSEARGNQGDHGAMECEQQAGAQQQIVNAAGVHDKAADSAATDVNTLESHEVKGNVHEDADRDGTSGIAPPADARGVDDGAIDGLGVPGRAAVTGADAHEGPSECVEVGGAQVMVGGIKQDGAVGTESEARVNAAALAAEAGTRRAVREHGRDDQGRERERQEQSGVDPMGETAQQIAGDEDARGVAMEGILDHGAGSGKDEKVTASLTHADVALDGALSVHRWLEGAMKESEDNQWVHVFCAQVSGGAWEGREGSCGYHTRYEGAWGVRRGIEMGVTHDPASSGRSNA